jgi:pimeloyl-ACP methyl ester carboxylesterase
MTTCKELGFMRLAAPPAAQRSGAPRRNTQQNCRSISLGFTNHPFRMLPFPEYQISNGSVALHVVANSERGNEDFAVAVVPGLSETAEDWRALLEQALPVSAAALTLRGRGASDKPVSGYTAAEHASDIAAFVSHFAAGSVLLVAFSRSVAYALEYAIARPPKLAGLVLLDYPPRHTALRPGWSQSFAQSTWRGRVGGSTVPLSVLRAIEREAHARTTPTIFRP